MTNASATLSAFRNTTTKTNFVISDSLPRIVVVVQKGDL